MPNTPIHKKAHLPHKFNQNSLTEYEVEGLSTVYNFADGHACHEMHPKLAHVLTDIYAHWKSAQKSCITELEENFKFALSDLINSKYLSEHKSYSISPTASNSIDIVSAWLCSQQGKVGLLEPIFDNLYLLLKRRNVSIEKITEEDLIDLESLKRKIRLYSLEFIFIVSPNNPTGFELSSDEFSNLCATCAELNVTLIIDKTFRFYSRILYDDYQTLHDSGVRFVTIEDTGKTWPTLELKASLMTYSDSIANEIRVIYEEVFLCTSGFTLTLLTRLMEETRILGIEQIITDVVQHRRALVSNALINSPFNFVEGRSPNLLPFAWLDCSPTKATDLQLVAQLKQNNIAVLPGRFFFWNSPAEHPYFIRLSYMKPRKMFITGLKRLEGVLPFLQTRKAA